MKKLLLLIAISSAPAFALSPCAAKSSVGFWYIGLHNANYPTGRFFSTLSGLSGHLSSGDTICVDSLDNASYKQNAGMRAQLGVLSTTGGVDNIRVTGYRSDTGAEDWADINMNGISVLNGKGIFDVYSAHFTLDHMILEFANNGGSDGSNDGVRLEMTVKSALFDWDYFHNDGMGINSTDVPTPGENITVRHSLFSYNGNNGAGAGQTHATYFNQCDEATIEYNVYDSTEVGHLIKSRCQHNVIDHNVLIEIPNRYSYDTTNMEATTSVAGNFPIGGDLWWFENVVLQGAFPAGHSGGGVQGGNGRLVQFDPECNLGENHWVTSARLTADITTTPTPGTVETIHVDPSFAQLFGAPPFTVEMDSTGQWANVYGPTNTALSVVDASDFVGVPLPFYIFDSGYAVEQVTALTANTFTTVRAQFGTTAHTLFNSAAVTLAHPEQFCVTSESADHSQWTGTRGCNGTAVTTHHMPGLVHFPMQLPPASGDTALAYAMDTSIYAFGNTQVSSFLGWPYAPGPPGATGNGGMINHGLQSSNTTVQANMCLSNPHAAHIFNNALVSPPTLVFPNANSTTTTTPSPQAMSVVSGAYGSAPAPPCQGSASPCGANNLNTYGGNVLSQSATDIFSWFHAPLADIQPTWSVKFGIFTGQNPGSNWVNTQFCGGTCTTVHFSVGDVVNFGTDGTHYTPYVCTQANVGLRPDQNPSDWKVTYATQAGYLDYHLASGAAPIGAATTLPTMPASVACGFNYADTCNLDESQQPVFPFGVTTRSTTTDSGALQFDSGYAPGTALSITGPSTLAPGAAGTYTVSLPSPATAFTPVFFITNCETCIPRPFAVDIAEGQQNVTVQASAFPAAPLGQVVTLYAYTTGNMAQTNTQIMAPPTSSFSVTGKFTSTGKIQVQ